MRLLLVGYGRMGRLIESLSPDYGGSVVGVIDPVASPDGPRLDAVASSGAWRDAEVAIDFTTAEAFVENFPRLAARGINVVVGTTGWQAHEAELRRVALEAGIGVVAAANFSLGVNLFQAMVARAARLMQPQADYGAFLHESHHAAKRDAPSGTALALVGAMERAGYARRIDVSSTRAGFIPGTHTVGFDGPAETITLTHVARDRSTFARGALEAARWLQGRRGWFGMSDVLGLD